MEMEKLNLLKNLLVSDRVSVEEKSCIAVLVQDLIDSIGCDRHNCDYLSNVSGGGVEFSFSCEATQETETMYLTGYPVKQKKCPYNSLTFEKYIVSK